jgi:hypothetical protein
VIRFGKYKRKSRLNSEMLWKKGKSNSDKIWTIWKKDKLNSEKIRKILNTPKLNSEKI